MKSGIHALKKIVIILLVLKIGKLIVSFLAHILFYKITVIIRKYNTI